MNIFFIIHLLIATTTPPTIFVPVVALIDGQQTTAQNIEVQIYEDKIRCIDLGTLDRKTMYIKESQTRPSAFGTVTTHWCGVDVVYIYEDPNGVWRVDIFGSDGTKKILAK